MTRVKKTLNCALLTHISLFVIAEKTLSLIIVHLSPQKYKVFFCLSSFLFGMIEIDMLKCGALYKDCETTDCAPSLSWMGEHVYAPGRG